MTGDVAQAVPVGAGGSDERVESTAGSTSQDQGDASAERIGMYRGVFNPLSCPNYDELLRQIKGLTSEGTSNSLQVPGGRGEEGVAAEETGALAESEMVAI